MVSLLMERRVREMSVREAGDGMDVVIENCRNIDHAAISIEPGKLNLKFAPNGTGKSSIAKALVVAVNGTGASDLAPFKWRQKNSSNQHPFRVSGLESTASVEVFDEDYVQSVVFQRDSLFPGGFDVFVRTPEFNETERNLKSQLQVLVELADREDVRKLSADLTSFLTNLIGGAGLGRNNKPRADSPAMKALSEGNVWVREDPLLTPFKPILGPGPFKKWVVWHKQGGDYFSLMGGTCPYCGQPSSVVKDRIDAVGNACTSVKAGSIEKITEAVSVGGAYMDKAAAERLNVIVDSAEPITDQAVGFIGKVAQDAQLIIGALAQLKTVSSFFDLSRADDLGARLRNCKLDIELVGNFKSDRCCQLAAEINKAVETALSDAGKLKGLVNRQKSQLAKSLRDRREEINAFLKAAGYPYFVDISDVDEGKCSVALMHTSMWEVADSRGALSYGERNAFALMFFAYECMRKKPDLVILDDPVSSFDGSKRYALLNMLFLGGVGEATLKGRTVLLLTHDYGTLFDIEHTHKPAFQPSARSCVLSCTDGDVTEAVVGMDDMILADTLYKALARRSVCLIAKLVYARKVLEIGDDKGDAYDVVSSLFHHRSVPTRRDESPMGKNEIANGIACLEAIVGESVYYDDLLDTINNPSEMLALFDASCSNYEKLQLARIATQAESNDAVLKERMDESVHVGNGFLYQLDPTKFELVPTQLAKRCRDEIVAMV